MYSDFRDSGIDIIGKVPWGTHISQLFSSKADVCEVMIPYIQQGLINNELCIWICSQNISCLEVKDMVNSYIKEADIYLKRGQLKIISYTEWYIENNEFCEIRVCTKWNDLIKYAIDRGFEGLRAVADTTWLAKSYFRSFANYEHKVHHSISELPFIVICLYDANKVDTFEVAEIIRNHRYIITKYEDKLELIKNVELLIKDKQLEESEERYKNLIQLLPDSIIIHDEDRIFYCNKSVVNMTGIKDPNDLLGISILELVPSKMKSDFRSFIKKSLKENIDADYFQTRFIYKGSKIKYVGIITTKYNYRGHPALLSVVRDITPIRKINELKKDIEKGKELLNYTLEYDKMKTEFFSNISHELRTPLNVILATIQLIKLQSCEFDKNNKYIKIMQQNCFRLLRLVNNIIDMTRIDSNYFDIKLQNYDIVCFVRTITMSIVEYANSKGINIFFDTNIKEKVLLCDPDQIERTILNLLSNSIKFTQNGGNIWVYIYDHGEKIEINIKDDGIGIPQDKQEYIFDRFHQVDKSLTRKHEGSGIGLYLVKALVEKHDGKITLKSELGKGSEFTIEIPCKTLEETEKVSRSPKDNKNFYNVERIKIELSDIY